MPEGTRCSLKVCPAHGDGVPGVVAAVVAGDDIRLGGQQIDDAAFALVPPLGADNDFKRHESPPVFLVNCGEIFNTDKNGLKRKNTDQTFIISLYQAEEGFL